ncbi:MAG: GAF domain-containing protein [Leptolyngbya sp. SIO4C1]|nr:GAF domain-containing protein [Leptolyngbya sp. SIO4C1]
MPLNGTRKTFGTIEVINRKNLETGCPDSKLMFTESDLCWLTIVGAHVSAAISRLRKIDEDKIFAAISRELADPENEGHRVRSVYQTIADKLVAPLMPYKVCIVRLAFDEQSLMVTDKSHAEGERGWGGRQDELRRKGEGIVGKVFETGKYITVEDIDSVVEKFNNDKWIEEQGLKSFICFPLVILGEVIGTLSLFTGYKHKFSKTDITFLKNVSFLLAAFKIRSEKIKNFELKTTTLEVVEPSFREAKHSFLENRLDLGERKTQSVDVLVLASFESSTEQYQVCLETGNYLRAYQIAEFAYDMCENIKKNINSVEDQGLYRRLVAMSSYWKLNLDLCGARKGYDRSL